MNDVSGSDVISENDVPFRSAYPPGAEATAYTFLRHTGFILDELCAHGLMLWPDEQNLWQWRWRGADLRSERGFWAIGEALVDAVVARYPESFSVPDIATGIE